MWGGHFTDVDSRPIGYGIAAWRDGSWESLDGGVGPYLGCVRDICTSGDVVYASGDFTEAGGVPANGIARWDGSAWSAMGDGVPGDIGDLVMFDDGTGDALYAGSTTGQVFRWDSASWTGLGDGLLGGISALTVFDDGTGDALYAGTSAGEVARLSGQTWELLGSGLDGPVRALAAYEYAGQPRLYAAWVHSDTYLTSSIAVWIPEPTAVTLLALGGLALVRRRRE